jgi:serine/threonine protein kinase
MLPATSPSLPMVGELVDDRYRIVALLGQGGMGAVYVAEQVALRREVALKVLLQGLACDDSSARRFEREARAASRIRHPNVVEVYDFGKLPSGCFYYVMERLEGEDLARLLAREGRLSWPRARRLLVQVVQALAAAHEQGIVHRDIKPSNCFIIAGRRRGDPDILKILDFGIAKTDPGGSETAALTGANDVVGTALYMAPEQAMGSTVDTRTDVYALGVVMFEMLTGRVPFSAPTGVQVLVLHTQQPPPSPRAIEPSISPAVESIILRALAKDPNARFSSMEAFEAALEAAGQDGDAQHVGPRLDATLHLGAVPLPAGDAGTELLAAVARPSQGGHRLASTPWPGLAPSQSSPATEILESSAAWTTGASQRDATAPDAIAATSTRQTMPGLAATADERASTATHVGRALGPSSASAAPRRRWPKTAAVLAMAATGTGVGYFGIVTAQAPNLEPEPGQDPESRSEPETDSAQSEASPEAPSTTGRGIGVAIELDAGEQRSTRRRPKASLEATTQPALEGVLPPRSWLGAPGSFAGRITRDGLDAEPIGGARVCAWVLDPEAPSELRRNPTCARSDRRGHYVLPALVPSIYGLTASAERFTPAHRDRDALVLQPGETRTDLDLALTSGGSKLAGHVRDHSGKAIRGAMVRLGIGPQPIANAVTDDRGAFSMWVEPGSYRLDAAAKRHSPAHLDDATPMTPAEVVLVREAIWVGRVVWQGTDEPASEVKVRMGDELAYTDREGAVRIGGLLPGPHDVRLDVPGTSDHVTTSITLEPGQTLRGTIRLPRAIEPAPAPEPRPEPAEPPVAEASAVEPPPGSKPASSVDPKVTAHKKIVRVVQRACGSMDAAVVVRLHTSSGKPSTLRVEKPGGGPAPVAVVRCVHDAVWSERYPLPGLGFIEVEVSL